MVLLPAITPLLDKLVTSTVVDSKKPSNTGSQVGSVVLLRILDDTQRVIERAAATSGMLLLCFAELGLMELNYRNMKYV